MSHCLGIQLRAKLRAEGQAFACLSFFPPLSLSLSVLSFVFCFFLFEELKMKVDSGRL